MGSGKGTSTAPNAGGLLAWHQGRPDVQEGWDISGCLLPLQQPILQDGKTFWLD